MNQEYQTRLRRVLAEAELPAPLQISYKAVFGAVAAYANGHIFSSCGRFGLALKLNSETCQALLAEGAGEPLKYFEKGHVKRNYVVLADALMSDRDRLRALVRESAAFVQR